MFSAPPGPPYKGSALEPLGTLSGPQTPGRKNVGAQAHLHFSTYFLEIACNFKTYWKPCI